MAPFVGQALKRKEDPRFIQGRGQYADNVRLGGMLHMAVLRSPVAHARIARIDATSARSMPGVVGVYTGDDFAPLAFTGGWIIPNTDAKIPPRPVVATDTVRFMGEAVAVVVAEDRYVAEDALERIEVEYDPLPVVVGAREAIDEGAVLLHESVPGNVAMTYRTQAGGDIDAAFAGATTVAKLSFTNTRVIPMPMETRVAIGRWDPGAGELTQWATSQNPHTHRAGLAGFFGLPEHRVRVISIDVGGGFGAKAPVYPEDVIVCKLSMLLERPVKWVESRRENCSTMTHGRDQVSEVEIAAGPDGKLLGIRGTSWANIGAYLSGGGLGIPTILHVPLLVGAYRMPALSYTVYGAYTNTNPVDAYRGAGRPEATFSIERMMDTLADELGMDPAELRRRNFIQPDEFPATTITGMGYDSGNYEGALDRALEIVDYAALRDEQKRLRAEGRYIGIGLSSYIECCGFGPSRILKSNPSRGWMLHAGMGGGYSWEAAHVRVSPTGKVWVGIGVSPHGQGEETTFAQIVADTIGCEVDDVEILHGDTLNTPTGRGTGGSRTLVMGGSAVKVGAGKIYEKAKIIAAHLLEAAPEDIELADGKYAVRGSPDKSKTWAEVAAAAAGGSQIPEGMEPGLEEVGSFDPDNFTFPFGTHVCIVEVDPDTGEIEVKRYVAVDDCGPLINPLVVEGQVHGGVVQGMAQALWESVTYDETGQLMTGSLMDYAVPKAGMLPNIETAHTVTPAPSNPLGVKGIGEAGTIASTPAVVNAVVDALEPFGVRTVEMPMTPERVWRAIAAAGSR